MTTTFLDLQNGFYNGMVQGLGQSPSSFQMVQPNPPIASGSGANTIFWQYYNQIPPYNLTSNINQSGGNQFYSNYRGLMSALEPSRSFPPLPEVIGSENAAAWMQYIRNVFPIPNPAQLPTAFRSWAMIYAPSVANKGASYYSAIMLDPIASAQTVLTDLYTTPSGAPKNFDWSLDYEQMVNQLNSAPTRSFNFASDTMDTNVSESWTSGSNSGFFGLWGGSSSTSSVSNKFASSSIKLTATFDHLLPFGPSPGSWYSSSAMGLAYANRSGNPWSGSSSINWENTFGSNGNMQRFMSNILICSGMSITVTSSASYSESEQTTIKDSGSSGFWPFYSGSSGHSSTTSASFSKSGEMTMTTSCRTGVPVVVGGNVLSVGEFVGHSINAARALADTTSKANLAI